MKISSLLLATTLLSAASAEVLLPHRFSFANETAAAASDVADASTPGGGSYPVCREMFSRTPYQIMEDYCQRGKVQIYDLPYEPSKPRPNPMMMMSVGGKKGREEEAATEEKPSCNCHTRIVLESKEQSSCGWLAQPLVEPFPLIASASCGAQLYDACDLVNPLGFHSYTMTQTNYGIHGGYHEQIQGTYLIKDRVMAPALAGEWLQLPYTSSMLVSAELRTPSVQLLERGFGSFLHDSVQVGDSWYMMSLLHYCDAPGCGGSDAWDMKEMKHLHLPVCWPYV